MTAINQTLETKCEKCGHEFKPVEMAGFSLIGVLRYVLCRECLIAVLAFIKELAWIQNVDRFIKTNGTFLDDVAADPVDLKGLEYLNKPQRSVSDFAQDIGGYAVWEAWCANMLNQGRDVSLERKTWATLPERDKKLDALIAQHVVESYLNWQSYTTPAPEKFSARQKFIREHAELLKERMKEHLKYLVGEEIDWNDPDQLLLGAYDLGLNDSTRLDPAPLTTYKCICTNFDIARPDCPVHGEKH